MMKCIVAVAQDWGIGKDGGLLARNKEDMKFFRSMTVGNVVIMGRKTLESFPGGKPLPDRENIVITREKEYFREGVHVVHSIVEAEQLANRIADGEKDIFVIGGEEIYKAFYTRARYLNLTEIESDLTGDAKFPDKFRKQFRIVKSSLLMEDPDTKVKYRRNIYKQLFAD